ncbi:MAG: polysaccharide deacetylase family protein [Cytophagales bacterium]|nr:MAG: polysaccharide deacetylase family protein [Cytophagales bacterium]
MRAKHRKRAIIIVFLFLFFYANLWLFKPFIDEKKGKGDAVGLLVLAENFSNFLFGKPFLANKAETATEQHFKKEVERQAQKFSENYFFAKPSEKKLIALTFDDSPDDWYCPQILAILEKHKVKATFFLIANRLKKYKDNAEAIKKGGHLIGNHSFSHKKYTLLSTEQALKDIDSAEVAFQKEIGLNPKFFRPPYGMITDEQVIALVQKDYKIINWSIDTYDWNTSRNSPLEIFTQVEQYAHNGGIILMHSSGRSRENTILVLPAIIKSLKSRGFRFVTLDKLLPHPL